MARDQPRGPGDCDLARLLDEAEGQWRGPLAASGRALRIRTNAAPLRVCASAAVVRQILDVLVDNAAGHGTGTITVAARPAGNWATIDVTDEGRGFTEDSERAFDRRGAGANGHGIGLALALAHAEGGRLTVADPGPGPRLRLVLPAGQEEPGARLVARLPHDEQGGVPADLGPDPPAARAGRHPMVARACRELAFDGGAQGVAVVGATGGRARSIAGRSTGMVLASGGSLLARPGPYGEHPDDRAGSLAAPSA